MTTSVASRALFQTELVQNLCQAINATRSTRGPTLVAIDGPGCSGKTTLADSLDAALGNNSTILGIDGFLIPFTEQDLSWKPNESTFDGVRHLRWGELERVISQLAAGRTGRYRPYNWDCDKLDPEIDVPPTPIVLVEGLYSLHARLRSSYSFKIWIDVSRDTRMASVEARDGGQRLHLWHKVYVPREWSYLRQQKPFEYADVFLLGAGLGWASTNACFSRNAA